MFASRMWRAGTLTKRIVCTLALPPHNAADAFYLKGSRGIIDSLTVPQCLSSKTNPCPHELPQGERAKAEPICCRKIH